MIERNTLERRRTRAGRLTASPAAALHQATPRVAGLGNGTVMTAVHEHAQCRDGTRPATTVRRERVRGGAARAEAPLAHAVRRLGWRVAATKHTAEEGRRAQGVAASRSASLLAQGLGRLQGRSLSLTPRWLRDAQRVVALIGLLRIARRVLVRMPCVVRRHLRHASTTRKGISPGQPGRRAQPTRGKGAGGVAQRDAVVPQSTATLSSHTVACRAKASSTMEVPRDPDGLVA